MPCQHHPLRAVHPTGLPGHEGHGTCKKVEPEQNLHGPRVALGIEKSQNENGHHPADRKMDKERMHFSKKGHPGDEHPGNSAKVQPCQGSGGQRGHDGGQKQRTDGKFAGGRGGSGFGGRNHGLGGLSVWSSGWGFGHRDDKFRPAGGASSGLSYESLGHIEGGSTNRAFGPHRGRRGGVWKGMGEGRPGYGCGKMQRPT